MSVTLKTSVFTVVLVIFMTLMSFTSARYLHEKDDRDKRQIGDLRAAEYLARITLDKNRLLQMLHLPSHCQDLACGLVDVYNRMVKRTMSDQRVAEILANMGLYSGNSIPIGHGQFDIDDIGKRRRRSLDSVFRGLNEGQRQQLVQLLLAREGEQYL